MFTRLDLKKGAHAPFIVAKTHTHAGMVDSDHFHWTQNTYPVFVLCNPEIKFCSMFVSPHLIYTKPINISTFGNTVNLLMKEVCTVILCEKH